MGLKSVQLKRNKRGGHQTAIATLRLLSDTRRVGVAKDPIEARRTAWIAGVVSLAADALAIVNGLTANIYRCFGGYTNRWSTFRTTAVIVVVAAVVAIFCVVRFDRSNPAQSPSRWAYAVIVVAMLATLPIVWIALQHRPDGRCFD